MKTSVLYAYICSLALTYEISTHKSATATENNAENIVKISGPYTSSNLSIFLIHGKDKTNAENLLTLEEAIQQKKVTVKETSNVNELILDNLSDKDVFIQSGDIVKGGKQDRVISIDIIVSQKSTQIRLPVFCVEHGRWNKRGQESTQEFNSAKDRISNKSLKMAAIKQKDQGQVWAEVERTQTKLEEKLNAPMKSQNSQSSMQLTLENKTLSQSIEQYIKALNPIIEKREDVIGYVFAINGHINNSDIYASTTLFKKMWPKLLKASAIEAIENLDNNKTTQKAPSIQEVNDFLSNHDKTPVQKQTHDKRNETYTQEPVGKIYSESYDKDKKSWIHKNHLSK